jgi:hypothetical protein
MTDDTTLFVRGLGRTSSFGGCVAKILDMNTRAPLSRVMTCSALASSLASVCARDLAGVSMPEVVSAAAKELRLNGMGIGTEKTFFKVYVVGLYLESKTTEAQTAIKSDDVKRIAFTMLRDVSRQKFVQAVEKGMVRNSGPAMPTLRARLNQLEEVLPALQKGTSSISRISRGPALSYAAKAES